MDVPGEMLHAMLNLPGISHFGLEERLPFRARVISANRDAETKVQFGRGSYTDVVENMVACESSLPVAYPIESRYRVKDWQTRRMLLDMEAYLPAVLNKAGRALARYSLTSFSPILNQEIIEYSFRLDHSFKYHKGTKKRILKDITHDYLPHDLLDRPKAGFSVPLDKWLRGVMREQLTDMVNEDFLRRQGLFHAGYTADFVKKYLQTGDGGSFSGANYSKIIWAYFVFQRWYERYMGFWS
jgi:asparagine synthase (glutamine-hydrolysing)